MKSAYSSTWKRSVQPRKQRKYIYNASLHTKDKLKLTANLSKDLRKKHNKRSMGVRKGDTVKIVRGQFKGKTGKIDRVNKIDGKIYIEDIEHVKKDGTKASYPLKASNLMITELYMEDKRRRKIVERKSEKKEKKKNG